MSELLASRFSTGHHVGAAKPVSRIMVRSGYLKRAYVDWPAANRVGATIYSETKGTPWAATWTPTSAWMELPNLGQVELTQDYTANGITVATIGIDNVAMTELRGALGDVYHVIERGYFSPWRGDPGPGPAPPPNAWRGKLGANIQIKLWQGYGPDGTVPTFTGLIDDCDVTDVPDRLTITARDFGQTLTDQHVFGWNISPPLPEPTVFVSSLKTTPGTAVGYGARASTANPSHPARYVTDKASLSTFWLSHDHTTPGNTEWVEIRVPRGVYSTMALHVQEPGMTMYVGIYARSAGLGEDLCTINGEDVNDGWVRPTDAPDPAKAGEVPGSNGGWPYIYSTPNMSTKGRSYSLGGEFRLGDDSIIRIGFRNLHRASAEVYRCGVERLMGVKHKGSGTLALRTVAEAAVASSYRPDSSSETFRPSNVTDASSGTRWLSTDRGHADLTEWIEIHVPKGRYESIKLGLEYADMDLYIGVYARSDGLKGKKCKFNGYEIPDGWFDGTFIDVAMSGLSIVTVPGNNGGWPSFRQLPNQDKSTTGSEKFRFATDTMAGRFDLGENSVIRVGFRNLYQINSGVFRAGAFTLKAYTRTGVEQPSDTGTKKVIAVEDLSDVVKVVLRWAGFKEWVIEPVGATISKGKKVSFNRADSLMDVIRKVQDACGYVFYINPPTSDDRSIGVPVFASNASIALGASLEIRSDGLMKNVQAKMTDEPLQYIIRVRGAESAKDGKMLGAQKEKRLMAIYRPPWSGHSGRLGGLIKHAVHSEPKLTTEDDCMVMAMLIALQEALVASAAEVELPGNPLVTLNDQVTLLDTGSKLNTRLYVARRTSAWTGGEQPGYATTLGGALVDTPDVAGVVADLRAQLTKMGRDPNQLSLGGDVELI